MNPIEILINFVVIIFVLGIIWMASDWMRISAQLRNILLAIAGFLCLIWLLGQFGVGLPF